jgi:hypothetical protein
VDGSNAKTSPSPALKPLQDFSGTANSRSTTANGNPIVESDNVKAVRAQVKNSYPFTPEAQKVIDKAFVSDQTKGPLGAFGNSHANLLGSPEAGGEEYSPTNITLGNNNGANQNVVAHEMLHAIHDTMGSSFNPNKFNAQYEAAKTSTTDPQLKKIFAQIDTALSTNGLYNGISSETLANERFAFVGESLGPNGLSVFPDGLKSFYSKIFTNDDFSNN